MVDEVGVGAEQEKVELYLGRIGIEQEGMVDMPVTLGRCCEDRRWRLMST